MNRPVEEFELSGLIDGELDPARSAEVRSSVEQDPVLHDQFMRLSEAHRAWEVAARSARFMPAVVGSSVPRSASRGHVWTIALLALALVVGRLVPKVLPVELSTALAIHGLILAAIINAVVWMSGRAAPPRDSQVGATS